MQERCTFNGHIWCTLRECAPLENTVNVVRIEVWIPRITLSIETRMVRNKPSVISLAARGSESLKALQVRTEIQYPCPFSVYCC